MHVVTLRAPYIHISYEVLYLVQVKVNRLFESQIFLSQNSSVKIETMSETLLEIWLLL